jgi:uncharacterized membrane protein
MYMHNNHCHRATAHWQLNYFYVIIIIIIILAETCSHTHTHTHTHGSNQQSATCTVSCNNSVNCVFFVTQSNCVKMIGLYGLIVKALNGAREDKYQFN